MVSPAEKVDWHELHSRWTQTCCNITNHHQHQQMNWHPEILTGSRNFTRHFKHFRLVTPLFPLRSWFPDEMPGNNTETNPSPLLPQILWINFYWQSSQSCALLSKHSFPPHYSLPANFQLMCFDTELWEQAAFSAVTFCGLTSLWRVSMIIIWTTVKSAGWTGIYTISVSI